MIRNLTCALFIILLIQLAPSCSVYQMREDLPEYTRYDREEYIPVFWQWKTRPTQKERYWIVNLMVDEDFMRAHQNEKGRVIGIHSVTEDDKFSYPTVSRKVNYLIVELRGSGYYFISEDAWRLYQVFEKHFVPEPEASMLAQGGFRFTGVAPVGSKLQGMNITNRFDTGYLLYHAEQMRFDQEVALPSGNSVFIGRCRKFEEARQYMRNKFPILDMRFCGTPIGTRALPTRGGFLRNFTIIRIDYILYFWGDKVVALPGD